MIQYSEAKDVFLRVSATKTCFFSIQKSHKVLPWLRDFPSFSQFNVPWISITLTLKSSSFYVKWYFVSLLNSSICSQCAHKVFRQVARDVLQFFHPYLSQITLDLNSLCFFLVFNETHERKLSKRSKRLLRHMCLSLRSFAQLSR